MSVKIMSLVFEAEIPDLLYEKDGERRNAKASTAKLVLLAYADHANDQGRAAYPGYSRLERKTALSRQGISDTLLALQQNQLLIPEGRSELNTNSYQIGISVLEQLVKPLDSDESSHLTQDSQATGLKPSFNHPNKPPKKDAPPARASAPAEVILFHSVTGKNPAKVNYEDVEKAVRRVNSRLRRPATCEDLLPFYREWCSRGYSPISLTWLREWAVRGVVPQQGRGPGRSMSEEQRHSATEASIMKFLQEAQS